MKIRHLFFLWSLFLSVSAVAEEGMWIPMLIGQQNLPRMQDLGFRLSAEDIYSVNHSSLKDAIVQFGGVCTAEIVSAQGLILTNHHCGLGAVQKLSSIEHDYMTYGFWAQGLKEEIPCEGLTVTLLVRMEDVTTKVLAGVSNEMSQLQRNQLIRQNMDQVEKEVASGTGIEARVRSFFYGNQYYLFVSEVFKDIRLVGTPPIDIGKFGGDTDNWMWPRHTGDFSIFRIYAGKDNNPAPYAADNVPYTPRKFLTISLKGYDLNDFTFVFGYPGTTREYLSSYGVDFIANHENPVKVKLRSQRLDIMNQAMAGNQKIRIQYTAKAAGVANYWKKMIGETRGIQRADAVMIKEGREKLFQQWAEQDPQRMAKYGNGLPSLRELYRDCMPVTMASICFSEGAQGIEVIRFAAGFRELVKQSAQKSYTEAEMNKQVAGLMRSSRDFYRNWDAGIDQKVMTTMLKEMNLGMDSRYRSPALEKAAGKDQQGYNAFATLLFSESLFTDSARVFALLGNFSPAKRKIIVKDPLFNFMNDLYLSYENTIQPGALRFQNKIDSLQRIYMSGLLEMNQGRSLYADANSTLRVAFGKISAYSPADAVEYKYYTTVDGVIQKEDSTVFDYKVNPRLREVYRLHDFGKYMDRDGTLHVAFTASNHTTGGNSGSPVLNSNGELIGINFDRNWEGTLSDLFYDPGQCRNIALDIRYCLFIVDRVFGNEHIIRELTIVN